MIIVGPEASPGALHARAGARAVVFVEHRVLLAARFRGFRPGGGGIAPENLGRLLARECPAMPTWWFRFPDSGKWRLLSATRPNRGFYRQGAHPQPLRGPHVYRAFPGHPRFRSQAEAKPRALPAARAASGAGGRLHRARHDQPKIVRMVRQAGAPRGALTYLLPAHGVALFLWVDTPTRSELIGSDHNVEEIRRFVEADSLGYLSLASLRKAVADERHEYCYACTPGIIRRSW